MNLEEFRNNLTVRKCLITDFTNNNGTTSITFGSYMPKAQFDKDGVFTKGSQSDPNGNTYFEDAEELIKCLEGDREAGDRKSNPAHWSNE